MTEQTEKIVPLTSDEPPRHRGLVRAASLLLATVAVAASVAVAAYWMLNRPKAERRPPRSGAVPVEVMEVTASAHRADIEAMGTVVPARDVALSAEVGGRIASVSESFVPGGLFAAGESILRIEPEDYELALTKRLLGLEQAGLSVRQRDSDIASRQSDLAKAQEALKVEQGRSAVARREYDLLEQDLGDSDRQLVLRELQLASAEAAVNAAAAAVESARAARSSAESAVNEARTSLHEAWLDYERTNVVAPFNGTVVSRPVERGSQVSPGQALARFVGTDAYWVRVQVPVDQLRWIDLPADGQGGSKVRVYHEARWGKGVHRDGRVIRLLPGLEPQGRMAQLIVSVSDPLGLSAPEARAAPLLLDAYVTVQIEGRELPDVIRVPRAALHDGERVWVASPQDTLAIRTVALAWSGKESVYVSAGLKPGERLITSDLGTPVEGLPIRVAGEEAGPPTRPAGGRTGQPARKEATP